MVVSKLIGETEKYLASLLAQAEGNDWVLFFDEAHALFGKRTQISGAQVRYGVQGLSYILKRVEDFTSIVVLAGNLKGKIGGTWRPEAVPCPVRENYYAGKPWQEICGGPQKLTQTEIPSSRRAGPKDYAL